MEGGDPKCGGDPQNLQGEPGNKGGVSRNVWGCRETKGERVWENEMGIKMGVGIRGGGWECGEGVWEFGGMSREKRGLCEHTGGVLWQVPAPRLSPHRAPVPRASSAATPTSPPRPPPIKPRLRELGGALNVLLLGWGAGSGPPRPLPQYRTEARKVRISIGSRRTRRGSSGGTRRGLGVPGGAERAVGGGWDPRDPPGGPQSPPLPVGVFQSRRDTLSRGMSPPRAISRTEVMVKAEKRVWGWWGCQRPPQSHPKTPRATPNTQSHPKTPQSHPKHPPNQGGGS